MKTGSLIVPESRHHCVVYRKSDGTIVHHHSVTVLPGAKDVEKDHIEARARHIIKSKGFDDKELGVLHIDRSAMRHDEKYKVDVSKGVLISEGKVDQFKPAS